MPILTRETQFDIFGYRQSRDLISRGVLELPTSHSAAKRQRQNETKRIRNKMVKSEISTFSKKLLATVQSDAKDEAESMYKRYAGLLDRAVSKGVYHKNTAARKKSRMNRILSSMK